MFRASLSLLIFLTTCWSWAGTAGLLPLALLLPLPLLPAPADRAETGDTGWRGRRDRD